MDKFRVARVEQGHTKIKNVPIAVTPEGFWCCPSPVVFQKTVKAQNLQSKPSPSSPPPKANVLKKQNGINERKPASAPTRSKLLCDNQRAVSSDTNGVSPSTLAERMPKPNSENLRHKVAVEFGEHGTSDLKVMLCGKPGFSVKMSVHRNVLSENSSFFADKLSQQQSPIPWLEIGDCDDIEIYVETVGLMYCKEMKHRLIKQSVSRVLRILKVAESIGFQNCIQSCLEYLEAVPWVGDEEEEKVLSSVIRLQQKNGASVTPLLKRVSSEVSSLHDDTVIHIIELVLRSNEERGRREMKCLVLKLLREKNNHIDHNGTAEMINGNIYNFCRICMNSLLILFKQASEPGFIDTSMDNKGPVMKQIALEADNLLWLLEILVDRQVAEEFALTWASQKELANIHSKLPTVSRYVVSCVTARFFVGIGRGEMLPSKETRQLLLHTWLQPLFDDYCWLQHSCRSFDRKLVEEGIGRTILTLPLEEQQNILLSWAGSFLKAGDNCPNLQRAFEVWWRRTFVRPHVELQGGLFQVDGCMTSST